MKKKFLLIYIFAALAIVEYLIYRTVLFSKYENKLVINESIPDFLLEELLNNHNLQVTYIKSYNYNKKCIGFDAIVNNKYYFIVTKLGKFNKNHFTINKSDKDFTNNYEITPFPPDVDIQIGQYFSFYDFPFNIDNATYYLNGKELQRIDKDFIEIIFKGNYINFSFNEHHKKNFGYLTPNEEISISFILYNNEVYSIINKRYQNHSFKDLHSILK